MKFLARSIPGLVVMSLAVLGGSQPSAAIPAFARKYETSCATCHIAFPKLTAFGEAFRRNGYQFPEGSDAQYTKQEPVSMGAEGQKNAFPNAIWPNAIPRTLPIALVAESEMVITPEEDVKVDFSNMLGEVELLTGGTMGENISFFGALSITDNAIEIEKGQLVFSNLGSPASRLNLRLGKFEPGVLAVTNHRRITPNYWITTKTVGDNQWSLEGEQKGIEVYGLLGPGRLAYNVGLVEGRENTLNTAKDAYLHLGYKIGGLRWDGVTGEAPASKAKPWIDNSIAFDGFGYFGKADLDGQDDSFRMMGGDVNLFTGNLNLIGGAAIEHHGQPFKGQLDKSANATHWFSEASYIVYPWFVPAIRYEAFKLEGEDAAWRLVPTLNVLIRANLKGTVAAELEKAEKDLEAEEIEVALAVGF